MASITLSWSANPTTDNVTGYKVFGANGTGVAIGSCVLLATVNALTWTDSGLPNNQARTYYIEAQNAIGPSAPEGPLNISTGSPSSIYVQNAGSAPSLQEGTHAGRPAAGTANRIYVETDTKTIWRDNGSSWDLVSGGSAASTTDILTGTDTTKFATSGAIAALWAKGSDVASASTTTLGDGGFFHITGTTTVTVFAYATDKAGRQAWLKFDGALTLTHNATSLILPTGANITTAVGDIALIVSEGSGNFRCLSYTKADGTSLSGTGSSSDVFNQAFIGGL